MQAGNWYRPPQPGRVSPSRFFSVVAYDFRHESGRNDAGGQGVARGQIVRYGLRDAPLCIGPARIGRSVDVTIRPSSLQPVAIALGTRFVVSHPSSTIFGSVHVPLTPPPPVIYQGVGQTTLAIPPLPELVDQPLVGQVVGLYNGFPLLSNPSVSHIGR